MFSKGTRLLSDPGDARSFAGKARKRRWMEFAIRFPDVADMKVLDLGGSPSSWEMASIQPAHVTTVNLDESHTARPGFTCVVADACELPGWLAKEKFDLVFSNSLLEHVGGHVQRQRLAQTVYEMGERHWVQTPYRYFPIEPHWLFPGMQFLPHRARAWVSLHWPYGHIRTSTAAEALSEVDWVELIGLTQMRSYFPASDIWVERFAGLPKSMVALRV